MYIGSNIALRALQEYVNRIRIGGGSSPTDGANLLSFVEGVNDLGLWNSMVCWPMRSSQNNNATSGSGTLISLGGLGYYNGTLVANPTWTADGLSFSQANTQYITTSLPVGLPFTASRIVKVVTNGNYITIDGLSSVVENLYFDYTSNKLVQTSFGGGGASLTDATTSNNIYCGLTSTFPASGNMQIFRDAASTATATGGASGTTAGNLQIGYRYLGVGQSFNGLIPFYSYFSTILTGAQNNSLYTLYKNTLGQGLAL